MLMNNTHNFIVLSEWPDLSDQIKFFQSSFKASLNREKCKIYFLEISSPFK